MKKKGEDIEFERKMSDCLEVVESLSQKEKNKILSVLQKDEKLRQGQEKKISLLKKEIQEIRMKGVLRAGDDQDKMCRRCRAEFGFIFNRGVLCPICRFKVCKNCQEFMFNGSWICIFCYKQRQLKWMTGEWASFEQNPLRKWASGSDIMRASFQLHPGPSINVDEPQQTSSNSRTRKNARNGMAGGEPGRTRVEAPRDGDQHKLSQLFDVLRSKKPDRTDQETQVRRITSARYHESDSDSSSSSDVENRSGHSSPNALSITESEKDAQVGDMTSSIESPRFSDGARSPKSLDSYRTSGSHEGRQERPIPSPRSPKPVPRKKNSDVIDPDRVVRPKVRQDRKSDVKTNGTSARLSVDDTSGVSMSRSLDENINDNHGMDIDRNRRAVSNTEINLQKHVTKTRESLERKQEASMTESLSDNGMTSPSNGDSVFKKTARKSHEGLKNSDIQLDKEVSEELLVAVRRQPDNESAILMRDSPVFQRKKSDIVTDDNNTSTAEKQPLKMYLQGQEDHIHVQRAGSPYSVSMDSLPSSHPSPTFNRGSIGGSSYADSSDTDSLSRFSHPEMGEFSGTESAHQGHEEDYVVEEITKARFQRVSKKVGQVGAATKLAKSPRTIFPGDIEIEERETQEASRNLGNNEEGGELRACQVISEQGEFSLQVQSKSTAKRINPASDDFEVKDIKVVETGKESLIYKNDQKPVTTNVLQIHSEEELSPRHNTYVEQKEVFEENLVEKRVVKPQHQVLLEIKFDETRNKSTAELSWFDEMQETDNNYIKNFRPHPRHSSVISTTERLNSETDSIEGMIDEMVEEGPIRNVDYGRQASGIESEGSFCLTPISPLPPEMFETKQTRTYHIAYVSDDNVLDSESDEGLEREEKSHINDNEKSYNKQTNWMGKMKNATDKQAQHKKSSTVIKSMGSLDKLIYDQGDLVESDNLNLDNEIEEALKTRSNIGMKSNSSSFGSLEDIIESETGTNTSDCNQEFGETVSSIQKLALESRNKSVTAITGKTSSLDKNDHFASGASTIVQSNRGKLQPKGSLDILIDNQHEYIEDINEDIELDKHFQYLTKKERNTGNLIGQDIGKAEESMSKESPSEEKISKITVQVTESVGGLAFDSELDFSTKTCYDKEKGKKIKSSNSLDILVGCQGDLINADQNIDLNEEFVAALEQELDTKDKRYEHEIDIHSDFTYLGIQQSASSCSKENLYHQEAETVEFDTAKSSEHDKLFGEKNNLQPTKLAIRTLKPIPLGYLGHKGSEESSDSDDLSVIEEEDEADIHQNEVRVYNIDPDEQTLPDSSAFESDQIKGIVKKQKEHFEKQLKSNVSENDDDDDIKLDHRSHVKGKIYTKVRDLEKKVNILNSPQASLHPVEKVMGHGTSKLHNKFKRLQDHWVAIEHHEADILDLEEDDEENNNQHPISDKSFPDGNFTEIRKSDENEGEKQNLYLEITKCLPDTAIIDNDSTVKECIHENSSFDNPKAPNSAESFVSFKDQVAEEKFVIEDNGTDNSEKVTKQVCDDIANLETEFTGHETEENELYRIQSEFSETSVIVRTKESEWKEPFDKSEIFEKAESDETVGILMTREKNVKDSNEKGDFNMDTEITKNQDSKTEIDDVETCLCTETREVTSSDKVIASEVENGNDRETDLLKSDDFGTEDKTTIHANVHFEGNMPNSSDADMSVIQRGVGHDTPHFETLLNIDNDEVSNLDNANCEEDSGSFAEVQEKMLTVCHGIPEGECEFTNSMSEDSAVCHSIEEVFVSEVKESYKIPANIFQQYQESSILSLYITGEIDTIGVNSADDLEAEVTGLELIEKIEVPKSDEDAVDSAFLKDDMNQYNLKCSEISEVKHIPLQRLTEMSKNVRDVDHGQIAESDQKFISDHDIDLSENLNASLSSLPPQVVDIVDISDTFKAPGTPPDSIKARNSSSSIPCSPDISSSSSFEEGEFFKSERLPGFPETPVTISECSVSQDDSGHVSGGSRGATPEHRRTDSGYSQSSLPSTLSTVTDRSEEEEDIDKIVANIHSKAGIRGNLLTVTSESRESIASYYSDAGDIAYSTVPVTGEVLFGVNYNYKTGMLEIAVKQCKNIAVADTKRNRSDPYVKTYLLPDRTRGGKRKTKIKKHTVNPTFDETLKYSISKSELENRTLWLTLWHSDRFGRNIFLGEVTINFDYYKFDDPSPRWYQLQERMDSQPSSMMVYKGDLSLCVRYVPANKIKSTSGKGKQKKESTKGQLEVIVKEARNLTAVRSNGFSDPFCKGYLLPERHKSSKQKTAVIKKDCNPVWNHTMVFEDVSLMELRERCLELTIWDYEKLSSNDFLGGVRLNLGTGVSQGKQVDWMDARGEEMSMWQAMLDRPNLWIDGALILRPNMEKRKY